MAGSTKARPWNGTGYRPNDISGNNYAGMAGMSSKDVAALDAAGDSWAAAQAAGDQAAMDAAHRQAEQIREKYNYSGGSDGSQYLPYQTYESPYQQQIDSLLGQVGSYGSFDYGPAPTYENRYAQQQELLDRLLNREDFSWSKETDPLWPVYKKQYLREGERATANALGQASAATGGRPSSYAVNAATQAGDYYATKLNDIIPQLYQQAYDKYLNEYSMMQQDLGAVNNQEQLDYAKYLDQLGQYNTDRGFAYNQYLDDYNRLQSALGAYQGQDQTLYGRYGDQRNWNYQEQQDQLARDQAQREFAQQLNAILQAGGTPGSQLRAQSGYTDEYVDTLANYYQQQLAQAAAKAAASGSSSRVSGNENEKETKKSDAVKAFEAGDHSDAVIRQLLKEGYTQEQLIAAGYAGNYFGGNGGGMNLPQRGSLGNMQGTLPGASGGITDPAQFSAYFSDPGLFTTNKVYGNGIYVGGLGVLNWQQLEQAVNRGEVVEKQDPKTGKYTYSIA